ncbi:hypothetical protein [Pelagibacterium luteolum]|uniref:hypothetical protein n=1 Tax=Pelagibacterium luteolum TaxID=440168 RepID=UPI0015A0EADD|nr:hypothetical protein [Pelagibacterium luteolum]
MAVVGEVGVGAGGLVAVLLAALRWVLGSSPRMTVGLGGGLDGEAGAEGGGSRGASGVAFVGEVGIGAGGLVALWM